MKNLLRRFAYTPMGSFGTWEILDTPFWCYTIERPWQGNDPAGDGDDLISCIPSDVIYTLALRDSPILEKSTKGVHKKGWEIRGVPGRKFIMIHPANTMDDLLGCVGVGSSLGWVKNKWAVLNSQNTFSKLMELLPPSATHTLEVRDWNPDDWQQFPWERKT